MIGSPESDLCRSRNFLVKLLLGPRSTKKSGTEVTEARNEAEALRTTRILAVEQQFAPLHGSATIITPPQPPSWPGQPPSFIYW